MCSQTGYTKRKQEENMNSEYYPEWETYKEKYPIVADLGELCTIPDYEEGIYRFVFDLFL